MMTILHVNIWFLLLFKKSISYENQATSTTYSLNSG